MNEKPAAKRSLWAFAPVLLLGTMVSGLLVMMRIATHDPGFAVEPNYYDKAVHWDRQRQQEAKNQRLGYELDIQLRTGAQNNEPELIATFKNARGEPLSGADLRVSAFHNARAGNVLEGRLAESAPGVYTHALPMNRPGLWELRFEARRGTERFTKTVRLDVPAGAHT